jgi:amino-acid N-acetyltransferase
MAEFGALVLVARKSELLELPTQTKVAVRKAAMRDVPSILSLINSYAAAGIMLPRTEFETSENIRDFSVACDGSALVGCAALHFYTPTTAEVRSLAVQPDAKQQGVGRSLVESLEKEAHASDLEAIFAFTYVEQFFARLGFEVVERGELPLKAWKDCLRCPKFQNCDEIAVLKRLRRGLGIATGLENQSTDHLNLIQQPTVQFPSYR